MEVNRAALWVCLECHGPAVRVDGTVHCTDEACGAERTLPELPEQLPWEQARTQTDDDIPRIHPEVDVRDLLP